MFDKFHKSHHRNEVLYRAMVLSFRFTVFALVLLLFSLLLAPTPALTSIIVAVCIVSEAVTAVILCVWMTHYSKYWDAIKEAVDRVPNCIKTDALIRYDAHTWYLVAISNYEAYLSQHEDK